MSGVNGNVIMSGYENNLVLTMAELKRVEVIQRVFREEVTMAEAAMVLGFSERHIWRKIPRWGYTKLHHAPLQAGPVISPNAIKRRFN